ncbi:MAG TPA: hypothetical protein VI197_13460 [Polyangiaceae bacterium]
MTRTIVTWIASAGLLGCTYTTKIHMEEVENNGGAAGEAATTAEEGNDIGGSPATGSTAAKSPGNGGSVGSGE